MKREHFGLSLAMAVIFIGAACSSSNSGGVGGAGGGSLDGHGGGAGLGGTGGIGTGGAGGGAFGRLDAGTDVGDANTDAPAGDALVPGTFTQVFNQILNNTTMPTPATSPATHAITMDELNLVVSWINAGALNN